MFGVALLFAVLTLIVGLLGGLLPSSLNFSGSDSRMRIATSVAAGLLLASALFVVIPEGFHTASGGHAHGDGDALSGPVALVMLEYEDGAISSGSAMSEIRSIVHGDGHGEHSDHEHDEDATFEDQLKHIIAQYDGGRVNATTAMDDIRALLDALEPYSGEEEEELSAILLGGALALGFLSMFVFSSLFHDHEHHAHALGNTSTRSAVIGITLHAATDGLAIGAAAASGDLAAGLLIVFAVLIHKFPEAVTLGVFSLNDHQDELKVYRDVGIFAASTPVMIILAYFLLSSLPTSWIGLAMLFAGGTLLYVAALDALPDVHDPETGTSDLLLVLGGVAAMTVVLVLAELLGLGHAH